MVQRLALITTFILLVAPTLWGQTTLHKYVLSNGGGLSNSGNKTMNLTVGQTSIGHTIQSNTEARIGFWFWLEEPETDVLSATLRSDIPFLFTDNYPNPFREATSFSIQLFRREKVRIAVYSIDGVLMDIVFHDWLAAGRHALEWRPDHLSAGLYVARASTPGGLVKSQQIVLVR